MIELFLICLAVAGAVAAGYNVMWGIRSFSEPEATAQHTSEQNTALVIMLVCCAIGIVLTFLLL